MTSQYGTKKEAYAMYAYIVQGYSSTVINERAPGIFQQISENYNLNYRDKNNGGRAGYQRGQHCGRYKNGYLHPETGQIHTLTLDIIEEYMQSYLDGDCENLEDFLYDRFQDEDDEFYEEEYQQPSVRQTYVQPQQVYPKPSVQPQQQAFSKPITSSYSAPQKNTSYSLPVVRGRSSGFSFGGVVVFIIVIAIIAVGIKSCSSSSGSDIFSNFSSAFSFGSLTGKKYIKIDASPIGNFEASKKCTIEIDEGEHETDFFAVTGTEFWLYLSKGTHTISIRSGMYQSDVYSFSVEDDTVALELYYYEDGDSKLYLTN